MPRCAPIRRSGGGMKGFDASAAEKSKRRHRDRADHRRRRRDRRQHLARLQGGKPDQVRLGTVALSIIQRGHVPDGRCVLHGGTPGQPLKDEGNVETALRGAGVLEAEYKVPYLAHAPLEPMNAVVQLKDGRLDIWTGTQIPLFVVAMAAEVTGLRAEQHPPACPVFRRQFRPAPGRRLCPPGGRIGEGASGTPNQDDLDARRGHDSRLPASARHGAHARRGQGWQGRGL